MAEKKNKKPSDLVTISPEKQLQVDNENAARATALAAQTPEALEAAPIPVPTQSPVMEPESEGVLTDEEVQNLAKEYELEQKYGDRPIEAGTLSLIREISFGASDYGLIKSGLKTKEELREIRDKNNAASITGTGLGIVGTALATGGASLPASGAKFTAKQLVKNLSAKQLASVAAKGSATIPRQIGKASTAAEKAFAQYLLANSKDKAVKSLVQKAAPQMLGSAVEGAAYGLGQLSIETQLGEADFNAENALAYAGTGALLGGVTGGLFEGAKATIPVFKTTTGKVVEKVRPKLENLKDVRNDFMSLMGMSSRQKERAMNQLGEKGIDEAKELFVNEGAVKYLQGTQSMEKVVDRIAADANLAQGKLLSKVDDVIKADVNRGMSRAEFNAYMYKKSDEFHQTFRKSATTTEEARLASSIKNQYAKKMKSPNDFQPTRADAFRNSVLAAKKTSNYKKSSELVVRPQEAYANMKTFLTPDGRSGYAVNAMGELVDVFSMSGKTSDVLEHAINYGRVTTYRGTNLPRNKTFQKLFDKADDNTFSINPEKLKAWKLSEENANKILTASEIRGEIQLLDEKLKKLYKSVDSDRTTKQDIYFGLRTEAKNLLEDTVRKSQDMIGENAVKEFLANNKKMHYALFFKDSLSKKVQKESEASLFSSFDALLGGTLFSAGGGALATVVLGAKKFLKSDIKRKMVILKSIEKQNQAIDNRIKSSVKTFFTGSAEKAKTASTRILMKSSLAIPIDTKESPKDKRIAFKNIKENLNTINNDPQKMEQIIALRTQVAAQAAPATTASAIITAKKAAQFLESKLPKSYSNNAQSQMFTKRDFQPSDSQLAKFERYLEAVEDPMSALEDIKSGTLTREAAETLQVVYPNIYQRVQKEAIEYMMKSEKAVSYSKRLQLGILLNIPSDASLTPEMINKLQKSYMSEEEKAEQQGATLGGLKQIDMASRADTSINNFLKEE